MMMRWFEPLKQMLIKEFIQLLRDPKMSRMIWMIPVIQVLMFGYVATLDVKNVPIAICDQDNSAQSRALVARFLGSGYFNAADYVNNYRQAASLINLSRVDAALFIVHGFGGLLEGRRDAPVQLIVDGTNSNTTAVLMGYAGQIVQEYNQQVQLQQIRSVVGRIPDLGGVTLDSRAWFNPNLDSRNFFLPGVVALIVLNTIMSLAGMAVVREKEIGTIEQIWVTPLSRLEFILGKTVPFTLIGLLQAALAGIFSIYWFHVPFAGSVAVLLIGALLFILSVLGAGLLISTVSQTQQQAMMSTIFFINPFMMLSGFIFPIANMPTVIQWFTILDPIRYVLVIFRGVFLKGIGMAILWPQFASVLGLGVFLLAIAVFRFRKTAG